MGETWNIKSYNKLDKKSKDLFCEDIAIFFTELHNILSEKTQEGLSCLEGKEFNYSLKIIIENLGKEFSKNAQNSLL